MLKKILKSFSLPLVFSSLLVLYYFNVEQTLFTWIIEKILILVNIILYLFAFPLFLELHKNNTSLREALLKVKERIFSFWTTTFLTFSLFLVHLFLFIVIFHFVFSFFIEIDVGRITPIGAIALLIFIFLISFILGFFACIKFLMAPFISYFEGKRALASLWRSIELFNIRNKIGTSIIVALTLFPLAVTYTVVLYFIAESTPSIFFLATLIYLTHFLFGVLFFLALFWRYGKLKEEKAKPVKIWTKIISVPFLTVGVFSLILFFVFSFNVLFRDYDPPVIDDSAITINTVKPEREENLYFFLKEDGCRDVYEEYVSLAKEEGLFDEIEEVISDKNYYEFIKNNPEKAKEFIEINKSCLDCFEKMTSMTHHTSLPPTKQVVEDYWKEHHHFARISAFNAAYLYYTGNYKEAFDEILTALRWSSLFLENSNGPTYWDAWTASFLQEILLTTFRELPKNDLEQGYLIRYAKKLEELESSSDAIKRSYKHEYMMEFKSFFDNPEKTMEYYGTSYEVRGLLDRPTFFYKPNKTQSLVIKKFKEIKDWEGLLEDDLSFYPQVEDVTYFPDANSLIQDLENYFVQDNMIGRGKYFRSTFVSPRYAEGRLRSITLQNRLNRISLLLVAYEKEKEELPDSLEELALKYNIEIPKDPFFPKKEIQYSKKERIIYSLSTEKETIYSHYDEEEREKERAKHMINF